MDPADKHTETLSELRAADRFLLASGAVRAYPLRSFLSMLGIAIGVMAVILLTSVGEGTRRYVLAQFSQFGTTIIAINPGKVETGGIPGVFGGTTQKLTVADAQALARLPNVRRVVPNTLGQARVEANGRGRSVYIYGTTANYPLVFRFAMAQGSFLPPGDPKRGAPIAVLGPKVKRELFDDRNALGKFVRIAGLRFRVIGVMEPKGRILGFDIDDAAYIPLATAMQMFNQDELMEIDVDFEHEDMTDTIAEAIRKRLIKRHNNREDFTLTTQNAMLETSSKIMRIITAAVAAIAGISLFVGAIGILAIMWISVGERTSEIGLLLAIGAHPRQILRIFLLEAVLITTAGGLLGAGAGLGLAGLLHAFFPDLPIYTSPLATLAALAMSSFAGIASGIAPARRAASLDPVEALQEE